MPDPFIAEIRLFAGNFAPRGWALCNGQILQIVGNEALFSLLGTNFGGDGRTNFGLPDLRSRVPIHPGQGGGLSNYILGRPGGSEQVAVNTSLTQSDEGHTHELLGGTTGSGVDSTSVATVVETPGVSSTTTNTSNVQPYLPINYIIALVGTFPSRN